MKSLDVFSGNLRKVMKYKKMRQSELCRLTGIPTSHMSKYCTGKNEPSMYRALAIAKALGISLRYLAGRVE